MKKYRHNKIIDLINSRAIETQEELQSALSEYGFNVTQATVSRDIKQLGLIKTQSNNGSYRYVTSHGNKTDDAGSMIFASSIISIDYSLNNVVIKCHTGMAQAVCAKLDGMNINSIVGTLAGDDTIFIITRSEDDSASLCKELLSIIKR